MCTLSLPMAWSNPGNRWLATKEVKERNHSKNPSSAISELNTDIRARYRRKGKKVDDLDVPEVIYNDFEVGELIQSPTTQLISHKSHRQLDQYNTPTK